MAVFDRALRYVYLNPAAEALIGREASALLGRHLWDLYGTSAATIRERFEAPLHTGAPDTFAFFNPDRRRWYEMDLAPYDGGLVCLFRDVSDERGTQEALVESERRFRTTADSVPSLLWTSGVAGERLFFNRAWEAFTGRTVESELGDRWQDSVHPDDLPAFLDAYRAAHATQTRFETEYRLRRSDGSYRWMLVRAHPRIADDGTFEGLTGACTDIHRRWISDRQQAFLARAAALLTSSLDDEATMQKLAEMMVPTLADWCTVHVRDGEMARVVATAHADPTRVARARDIQPRYPVRLDDAREGVAHVMRTGEPILVPVVTPEMIDASPQDAEYRQVLHDFALTSVLMVPMRAQGEVFGVLSLIGTHGTRTYEEADVRFAEEVAARTAQAADNARLYREARAAEAALRVANDALEARVEARTAELARTNHDLDVRNRELQDFAAVASHDLQEPLRKIQSFASMLADDGALTDDEMRHYVGRIGDAAARMSRLIQALLSFARVTTKGTAFTDVPLDDVLAHVLTDLDVRLSDTDGRVVVEGGPLPVVHADRVQMQQLLQNLLGNALKFHRPGVPPVVTLSGTSNGATATLVVQDNDIGIDAKYADRIFAPFQRLHSREAYEGTGMGLAIVRRIVDRHHGTVALDSTPGEGSRFTITLPLSAAAEAVGTDGDA